MIVDNYLRCRPSISMIIDTPMPKDWQDDLKLKTFVSGESMTLESNYYWMLDQGVVKTSTTTDEETQITFGYWGINDLIGSPLSSYPCKAKCITTVKAWNIPLDQTDKITSFIQHHVQQMEKILYILRSDQIYQRLRGMLIWLGNKFGRAVDLGQMIDLSLTHQDLAELIGTTRATVTRLVNQLEQERFLSRPKRNTFILHK